MIDLLLSGGARILARLPVVAFVLSLSSCSAFINGIHGTTITFPVERQPDYTFSAWTDITLQQDISSVNSATLVAVTLSVKSPAGTPDLSFFGSIVGSVENTKVVSMNKFPSGVPYVTLEDDYLGNLKALFEDSHTIHIDWNGTMNPKYKNWPATGFEVQADIEIDVQQ
jgi:hypothetical protein